MIILIWLSSKMISVHFQKEILHRSHSSYQLKATVILLILSSPLLTPEGMLHCGNSAFIQTNLHLLPHSATYKRLHLDMGFSSATSVCKMETLFPTSGELRISLRGSWSMMAPEQDIPTVTSPQTPIWATNRTKPPSQELRRSGERRQCLVLVEQ